MSGHTLSVLLPETVESHWADLRTMLAPGMEHSNGEFDVDDILTMVQSQRRRNGFRICKYNKGYSDECGR